MIDTLHGGVDAVACAFETIQTSCAVAPRQWFQSPLKRALVSRGLDESMTRLPSVLADASHSEQHRRAGTLQQLQRTDETRSHVRVRWRSALGAEPAATPSVIHEPHTQSTARAEHSSSTAEQSTAQQSRAERSPSSSSASSSSSSSSRGVHGRKSGAGPGPSGPGLSFSPRDSRLLTESSADAHTEPWDNSMHAARARACASSGAGRARGGAV